MLQKILRKAYNFYQSCKRPSSVLVEEGVPRSLYKTPCGDLYWLDRTKYLDNEIIRNGEFEKYSTALVNRYLKKGDIALDIGANIGYYTVLMARIVQQNGMVVAFEPTAHFKKVLQKNLKQNTLCNVQVENYGLSDSDVGMDISINESTATLHYVGSEDGVIHEAVSLKTLDSVVASLKLERVDFIKMDVDGHEPSILKGAVQTIERFSPLILLEISHMHYIENGTTAWDFYTYLQDVGYYIYDEDGPRLFEDKTDFLKMCGNFTHSRNVLLSKQLLD